MGTKSILGEKFYSNLALPWRIDLAADQHMGAPSPGQRASCR